MRTLEPRHWLRREAKPLPPVYVGSYEDKLSRIRPFHADPDHERQTREDKLRERAERDGGFIPPFRG
jgi:hypothetical protein